MVIATKWKFLLLVLLFMMLPSTAVRASGLWYVAPGGNNANDCQSPTTPCATINGAIAKASAGDTIHLASGSYTGRDGAVVIASKNITLLGGWNLAFDTQDGMSIIDGENIQRGMTVDGGVELVAERLLVQHGVAFEGAGIAVGLMATLTLNHSAIIDNHATFYSGGGILVDNSVVNLNNVTISGNTALIGGGAIEIRSQGEWTVVTVKNSTITRNAVPNSIGNLFIDTGGIHNSGATVYVENSIIAGNTSLVGSPDCQGNIISQGYNLLGSAMRCSFSTAVGDLLDRAEVGLLPFVNPLGVYPLATDSPAVDAGNPSGCTDHAGNLLTTDQRGAARQGRCDIGAYERATPGAIDTLFNLGGSAQSAELRTQFAQPLQVLATDKVGTPAAGIVVTFTVPTSGASGTFALNGTTALTTVTDANGVASTILTANQTVGHYTATATLGATVAQFALTNELISTTTTIAAVTPEPSVIGQPISVTFRVTSVHDLPTGVVTVTVNNGLKGCSGLLNNGSGACAVVLTEPGSYTLTATFAENVLYRASQAVALHRVRLHEAYLPLVRTRPFLITGAVTLNGSPVAGIPLSLENAFDSNEQLVITDAVGKYYAWIVDQDVIDRNVSWQIKFSNENRNLNYLSNWSTNPLQSPDPSTNVLTIPTFDIGGLQLVAPAEGAKKDMPVEFRWKKRTIPGPNEQYQVFFNDFKWGVANGPWWPYPTEKEMMDCVRYDEPIDLENGEWWVNIQTSEGQGSSFSRPLKIGKTLICNQESSFALVPQ